MKVPDGDWVDCGGTINETIKIKISDEELGTECITKAKTFVPGQEDEIVWNNPWNMMDDLLLNCTKMKIDPVKSRLQGVVIQGTDEVKDCIEFLEVVLNDDDDGESTKYKKDPKSNILNKI